MRSRRTASSRSACPCSSKGYLKQYGLAARARRRAICSRSTTSKRRWRDVQIQPQPHDQAARRAPDHVVDPRRDRAARRRRRARRLVVERRHFGAASVHAQHAATADGDPAPEPAVEPEVTPAAARRAAIPLERRCRPASAAADPPSPDPADRPAAPGCRRPSRRPTTPPTTATRRRAPAAAIPLELTFEEESWAEITDARGERLLFGLNAAGRNVTVRGEPPFAIVLGNADAVRLTVDGEPYAIPTSRPPRQPRAFRRRHRRGVTPPWPS